MGKKAIQGFEASRCESQQGALQQTEANQFKKLGNVISEGKDTPLLRGV
jgi:hypothetical protein